MKKAAKVILTAGGVLMVLVGAPVAASTGFLFAAGCMLAAGLVCFDAASRVAA